MSNDSQTAIVSPAQVRQFADFLDESMRKLRSQGKRMREATDAARAVWKDEKYEAFQRQMQECVDELDRFTKTGKKYSEFLHEKASLADRYLNRR